MAVYDKCMVYAYWRMHGIDGRGRESETLYSEGEYSVLLWFHNRLTNRHSVRDKSSWRRVIAVFTFVVLVYSVIYDMHNTARTCVNI